MVKGAVIISSGTRARLESPDPLQMIGTISAVQRLIMTFHLSGVDSIVIVVSEKDEKQLEKFAGRNGVELLREHTPEAEMFDNAKLGLSYLENSCGLILITPVDIPLFSVNTVKALLQSKAKLAVPSCDSRTGHPLLMAREVIPEIMKYQGERGLRGAVKECGIKRIEVEVPDTGVYVHSDQFEECEKIIITHNRDQWKPLLKVRIAKDSEAFFGPGSWQLLSLIETTGSVRLACEEMGISYSKAWQLLNRLEKEIGYRVIVRKHGGKNGGETYLTGEGKTLLEQYEAFETECNQAVGRIFKKYFGLEENGRGDL